MNVAEYLLAAVRDHGAGHVFMDPGGLDLGRRRTPTS